MSPTWFDVGLRSSSEVWRAVRKKRALPPVPGDDPDRAAMFRAALEQAEQQLRAAGRIDFDSRALNLFYGCRRLGVPWQQRRQICPTRNGAFAGTG